MKMPRRTASSGKAMEIPDDRESDHGPADGELCRPGHGESSESDDRASFPLKPGLVDRVEQFLGPGLPPLGMRPVG